MVYAQVSARNYDIFTSSPPASASITVTAVTATPLPLLFHSSPPASARWDCLAGAEGGRTLLSRPPNINTSDRISGRPPRQAVFLFGAPGMGIDLEVEVLSRAGHSERSEPRSVGP